MILLAGPFPPPTHGASAVTEKAAAALVAHGLPVDCVDVSPLGRGAMYHLSRLWRFLRLWWRLLTLRSGSIVYISLSGGSGLIYDVVSCFLARLRKAKMKLHHHSYAYINHYSPFMAFVVRQGGKHIFLSPSMAAAFRARYGPVPGVTISNLAFFPAELSEVETDRPLRTIGYLSNISFEKGVERFLTVVETLRARGSRITARLAGPIADPAVSACLKAVQGRCEGIEHVGPVYGPAKAAFLDSLDYFAFPSLYVNEAQPMVVYEAQLAGLPVALSDRGSLADMAGPDDYVLDTEATNLQGMVEKLLQLEADPEAFAAMRQRCAARRNELLTRSQSDLSVFIGLFS